MGQVDLRYGGRLGLNAAGVGGDGDELANRLARSFAADLGWDNGEASTRRMAGFTAGGFLLVDFSGPFAFQPELRYMQRGYEYDLTLSLSDGSASTTITETLVLDYLEVPVFARYNLPFFSSRFRPHVIAGPTVGFNIVSQINSEDQRGNTATRDPSNGINTIDAGVEVGAGLDIPLVVTSLVMDVRYGLGVTTFNDDETGLSLRHRALIFTVGFSL